MVVNPMSCQILHNIRKTAKKMMGSAGLISRSRRSASPHHFRDITQFFRQPVMVDPHVADEAFQRVSNGLGFGELTEERISHKHSTPEPVQSPASLSLSSLFVSVNIGKDLSRMLNVTQCRVYPLESTRIIPMSVPSCYDPSTMPYSKTKAMSCEKKEEKTSLSSVFDQFYPCSFIFLTVEGLWDYVSLFLKSIEFIGFEKTRTDLPSFFISPHFQTKMTETKEPLRTFSLSDRSSVVKRHSPQYSSEETLSFAGMGKHGPSFTSQNKQKDWDSNFHSAICVMSKVQSCDVSLQSVVTLLRSGQIVCQQNQGRFLFILTQNFDVIFVFSYFAGGCVRFSLSKRHIQFDFGEEPAKKSENIILLSGFCSHQPNHIESPVDIVSQPIYISIYRKNMIYIMKGHISDLSFVEMTILTCVPIPYAPYGPCYLFPHQGQSKMTLPIPKDHSRFVLFLPYVCRGSKFACGCVWEIGPSFACCLCQPSWIQSKSELEAQQISREKEEEEEEEEYYFGSERSKQGDGVESQISHIRCQGSVVSIRKFTPNLPLLHSKEHIKSPGKNQETSDQGSFPHVLSNVPFSARMFSLHHIPGFSAFLLIVGGGLIHNDILQLSYDISLYNYETGELFPISEFPFKKKEFVLLSNLVSVQNIHQSLDSHAKSVHISLNGSNLFFLWQPRGSDFSYSSSFNVVSRCWNHSDSLSFDDYHELRVYSDLYNIGAAGSLSQNLINILECSQDSKKREKIIFDIIKHHVENKISRSLGVPVSAPSFSSLSIFSLPCSRISLHSDTIPSGGQPLSVSECCITVSSGLVSSSKLVVVKSITSSDCEHAMDIIHEFSKCRREVAHTSLSIQKLFDTSILSQPISSKQAHLIQENYIQHGCSLFSSLKGWYGIVSEITRKFLSFKSSLRFQDKSKDKYLETVSLTPIDPVARLAQHSEPKSKEIDDGLCDIFMDLLFPIQHIEIPV
ncbi:hypothetical protein ADUPG1_007935 [Aduncisulcus paluster]|uniref:CST complex subunit CTC1 n=1 Tax=Aduncisulcus paluster TaxID=2918883 RepID=A0ABQ5KQ38_9EUKA|nr:hypothetical protein ADUPG1_007935 [Aduncisulcus paluster]